MVRRAFRVEVFSQHSRGSSLPANYFVLDLNCVEKNSSQSFSTEAESGSSIGITPTENRYASASLNTSEVSKSGCPLVALSRHANSSVGSPLSGVKQTSQFMS